MSRLLLEICPDESAANGAAAVLPPILICAHEGQDSIAFEGTLGGKPVILRFKDGACAVENPTDAKRSVMGLGEWHVAEGWKLRVTQGISIDANLSVATDDPSWAEPEIHVTTFNGDQTKRFRTVLPTGEGSELVAGRDSAKAALVIDDEHVSRAHLRFSVQNGKRLVEDLGSRWGTKLNGQPLTDPRALKHGDELRLGKTCINYICYMDIVPESPPEPVKVDSPAPEVVSSPKPREAKPVQTAATKPAAKSNQPAKPVIPATSKIPEEKPTAENLPALQKPGKPTAAVDAKSAQGIAGAENPAEKAIPKSDGSGAADAMAKSSGQQKPASVPVPVDKMKTAELPPPATAIAKPASVISETQKSPALFIVGAAIVIIILLAGMAYLGYQLFVRRH